MRTPERGLGGSWSATRSPELKQPGVVLLPVGAVEQHGPHLPVGVDTWIAAEVAARVGAPRHQVWCADPLPFGCSNHHLRFPGTMSLGVRTFMSAIADLATSLGRWGHTLVAINGHGGNRGPLQSVAQELIGAEADFWAVTYFDTIADLAQEAFPPEAMGHACALETSIAMHLWPDLVSTSRPDAGAQGLWPDPSLYGALGSRGVVRALPFDELDESGIVGAPAHASASVGEGLLGAAVARVGEAVDQIVAQGKNKGEK